MRVVTFKNDATREISGLENQLLNKIHELI